MSSIPVYAYGGTERVIWDLAKQLVNFGHQVTFLVPKGSYCDFAKVIEVVRSLANPSLEESFLLGMAYLETNAHEKAISLQTQKQFTALGTDILEHSLNEVLEQESKIGYDGYYGLILPKGFKSKARI